MNVHEGLGRAIDDRWLLPIEGLVSGVLTYFVTMLLPAGLGRSAFLVVGLVFGAVIAVHARLFRRARSIFRLFGFVATCAVAYTASVFATIWSPLRPRFLNFSGTGSGAIDSSPFFVGGVLGAAIVCAGIFVFLAPWKHAKNFLLKASCISLTCGLLGVLGWSLGERLSHVPWLAGWGDNPAFLVLCIIWQTGAITLFGFLLLPLPLPGGSPPQSGA